MNKSRRVNITVAALFGIGLTLGGLRQLNGRGHQMKEVVEIFTKPLDTPNPYVLKWVEAYRFVEQVGEVLVRRDQHQFISPGLAKTWHISDDRHSIVFSLRPNLYSAAEVEQSLKRLLREGQTNHSNFSHEVTQIVVRDELTIELRTRGDAGAVLAPLTMADAAILPDSHWVSGGNGHYRFDWRKSRGPYLLREGNFPLGPDSPQLRLVPNEKHYLYEKGQVAWVMRYIPASEIQSVSDLDKQFAKENGYYTLRSSPAFRFNDSMEELSGKMNVYDTKPNSVGFLCPNLKAGVFTNKKFRMELMRRVFSANISLGSNQFRAFQIPQPGLVGTASDADVDDFKKFVMSVAPIDLPEIGFRIPDGARYNQDWLSNLLLRVNTRFKQLGGTGDFFDSPAFSTPGLDLQFRNVGMGDEDPISGATFMFSPEGVGRDLPELGILAELNKAKGNTDLNVIRLAVKKAFWTALTEGLVIPIFHSGNRHYHSSKVRLNIKDPFSEGIRIWDVRVDD